MAGEALFHRAGLDDRVALVDLVSGDDDAVLAPGVLDEIARNVDAWSADPAVRTIVVRGAPGTFCTGFATASERAVDARMLQVRRVQRLSALLEAAPLPVIAAVDGPAVAGGFALALMCDLIVASDEAVFGVGDRPSPGLLSRLRAAVGTRTARWLAAMRLQP